MEDTDLVQMFESLIATGLKNFLGCPAVFNEDALTEFFANSYVIEDGLVVSTVNGVSVEISEEVFAATFELPVDGLTDLSEVPKNLVFDARSLFSISKEQELRIASITEATTGDADAAIEQVLAQLDLVIQDSDVERSYRIETWSCQCLMTQGQYQKLVVAKPFVLIRLVRNLLAASTVLRSTCPLTILMQISEDMMLPSVTAAEITKIRLGESINIHEVQERDLYYASLPRISIHDKGKEILEKDDPVRGNLARETVELICGDVDFLVQLRDRVMKDVVEFFHSFSLNKLTDLDSLKALKAKESLMLKWAETDSLEMAKKLPKSVFEEVLVPHCYLIEPVQYWGAAPSLIKTWGWARVCTEIIRYSMFGSLRPVCREIVVYNLGVERIPDYLLSDFQRGLCTDTFVGFFSGSSVQTDSEIELSSSDGDTVYRFPPPILQDIDSFEEYLQFDLGPVVSTNSLEEQLYCVESPESTPPIPQRHESSSSSSDSQMNFDTTDFPLDDTTEAQTSLPAATVEAIDDLRSFILQRIDDSNSAILSKLHTLERGLRDALHDQDDNARKLNNSVCQDAQTISDVQKIHLNDVKKIVLAQGVTAGADSLEIKKAINAVDAKILLLDGQVATIRSKHLEFQERISADLLGLSTQIGDLVDYIRSGDAKKGEGSSSRRPLPTPVHHSEGTGDAVRLTEPTQADIDNENRAILKRMRNEDSLRAERERDRARRERRLSRSGAYKRRRGF
ncbi:hypothetical protein F511_34165 [Dorcoceras hygrometricum]|uniref:Dystroglycan-like n=1 Tax=Dorcoceras hygrometricum TaxID=472368 RepID=A0A2Z7DEK9_9LAMI|nr:hypothetical protein F511_34165 [Dorcoceras hygrometricum]